MKRLICAVLAAGLLLSGCGTTEYTTEFFAMNTVMRISGRGKVPQESIAAAEQRINKLDRLLSRTRAESEISALNHADGEWVTVSDETLAVLETALTVAEQTDGAYDPTVAPLTDLWQIGTEDARIPSADEIDAARALVNYENVEVDGSRVRLLNGAQLDLGGVAKGWAGGNVLAPDAVDGALLELGGNISCFGKKQDGSTRWNIGVADPDASASYIATVAVENGCAVTTGDYERFFEENGVRYHHVFDPATGYPADSGLRSVTVVMDYADGGMADGYSTALFVMGLEDGLAFCEAHGIAAAFITTDKTVHISGAMEEKFTFMGEDAGFAFAG
ncbi:MAG: FAD:protein FMN transferase [Butyricicoccus sp.]|nr:FAD:protein FMN transferase [Butyricicoccus sp.]